MTTAAFFTEFIHDNPDLLQLEVEIARRADELADHVASGSRVETDRDCWLRAEAEVLTRSLSQRRCSAAA